MRNKSPFIFDLYRLLLILLIAAVVITNFLWLMLDTFPPQGNGLNDILPGVNLYRDIIKGSFSWSARYLASAFPTYPPIVPLSYSVFYLIFGPFAEMEIMVNSLYLIAAAYALFGIGRIFNDKRTGLLSVFLFLSFPGVIRVSRYSYAEFFAMCMLCVTAYLLLKTEGFRKRRYCLFLGAAIGLQALIKWDFAPAFLGPLLLALWKGLHTSTPNQTKKHKTTVWKNFLYTFAIAIVISGPWYATNFQSISGRFALNANENLILNRWMHNGGLSYILTLLTYYPLALANAHLKFCYTGIFAICLIMIIFQALRKNRHQTLNNTNAWNAIFLLSWITLPLISFTATQIYNPSHIMLVLPAVALIMAIGIMSLRRYALRYTLISLVILYGSYLHLHAFIRIPQLEPLFNLRLTLTPEGTLSLLNHYALSDDLRDNWERPSLYPPVRYAFQIKDILTLIKDDSAAKKYKPVVMVLDFQRELSFFSFQYYNLLGDYGLYIEPRGQDRSEFAPDRSLFDYVIIHTPDAKVDEQYLERKLATALPNYFQTDFHWDRFKFDFFRNMKYTEIKRYSLTDNTIITVYRRNGP